jgi:hypothetical protein
MSNGCTSGHGLCGIPRFSIRSIVAVCTFLFTAIGISYMNDRIFILPWNSIHIIQHDNTRSILAIMQNLTYGLLLYNEKLQEFLIFSIMNFTILIHDELLLLIFYLYFVCICRNLIEFEVFLVFFMNEFQMLACFTYCSNFI